MNFYTDDYVTLNPQINAASLFGGEVLFKFSCMWTLLMPKLSCSLQRTQNYQKNVFVFCFFVLFFVCLFLDRSVEKNKQVIDR